MGERLGRRSWRYVAYMNNQNILGIDPGTANIGFAILRASGTWKSWTLHCKSSPISFVKVYEHLTKIAATVKPDILVVESLPLIKNPLMVVGLSSVVAAVGVIAYQRKIKYVTVLPSVWKKAVGGYRKGIGNEELIANRYHFTESYDEHAASAVGCITAVLEEGKRIEHGKLKWVDFSSEGWRG